jgi:hypothetical protein
MTLEGKCFNQLSWVIMYSIMGHSSNKLSTCSPNARMNDNFKKLKYQVEKDSDSDSVTASFMV